jgi:hypothetical protein
VQILAASGHVLSQTVGSSVAAGGSADVTFAPFLEDEVTAAGGAGLANTIIAAGANALWKLDETSGSVAHDSSGNGFNLGPANNPSAWGGPAGPPGTLAAVFDPAAVEGWALNTYTKLGDAGAAFSVFGWMKYNDTVIASPKCLVNQSADVGVSFGQGWALMMQGANDTHPHHLLLYTNDTSNVDPERFASDNTLALNTWFFVAVTWSGTTWHMFVNAVQQAGTDSRAWTPNTGISLGAIRGLGVNGGFSMDGSMSWWAAVPGIALTATQLAAIMASVP